MFRRAVFIAGCLSIALIGCTKKPLTPAAPWTDIVNDSLCFLATTTDPGGLGLEYTFDWSVGQTFTTRRYQSGETAYARRNLSHGPWREVRVRARNENGKSSAWSAPLRFRRSEPPVADTIGGFVRWVVNRWYPASVQVFDPDSDSVSVKFIWDGVESRTWTEFAPSGSSLSDSCLWTTPGPHTVKVIARDRGSMVARPAFTKTVTVSGMAVTWYRRAQEHSYTGSPALGSVDGEPVIYCLADERMDCFGLDGKLRWASVTSSSWGLSASLGADGSRLYVPGSQGLVCLDARTGLRKWLLPDTVLGGSSGCTPALGPDGAIYVTVSRFDGYQLARVRDFGDSVVIQWLVRLGDSGPRSGEAVVGRNGVVFALGATKESYQRLCAVSSTGSILWIDSTHIRSGSTPVIDGRDRLLVQDDAGSIFCFNPEGSLAWATVTGEPYPGPMAIGENDEVLATDRSGVVLAFDSAGRHQWSRAIDYLAENPVCVAAGGVVIAYDPWHGFVCGLDENGALEWEFSLFDSLGIELWPPSEIISLDPSAAIGPNGDLFLAGADGVFCLSGANLHLANTAWPTYNHDAARSGWAGRP